MTVKFKASKTQDPGSFCLVAATLFLAAIQLQSEEALPLEQWFGDGDFSKYHSEANRKQRVNNAAKISHVTFHYSLTEPGNKTKADEIRILKGIVGGTAGKFGGIAYHYFVGNSGTVYEGRSRNIAPASGTVYFSVNQLGAQESYNKDGGIDKWNFYTQISLNAYTKWKKDHPALASEWETTAREQVKDKPDPEKEFNRLKRSKGSQILTPGDTRGHITICFLCGSKGSAPTAEAYDSAARLAAKLLKEYQLSIKDVRVHREVAFSSCPGPDIYNWVRQNNRLGITGGSPDKTGDGLELIQKYLGVPIVDSVQAVSTEPKIVSRAMWKAKAPIPAAKGQYQSQDKIEFLSIHHTKSYKSKEGISEAQLLRNIQDGHLYLKEKEKPWPILRDESGNPVPHFGDIAYHYLIGASGNIYEGRSPSVAPSSYRHYYSKDELKNANYDLHGAVKPVNPTGKDKPGFAKGHLTVSFMCGLPKDELLEPEVMKKSALFIAELLHKHGLGPKDIRLHREVASTACPGNPIYKWIRGNGRNPSSLRGVGMKMIIAEYDRLEKR